MSAVDPLACAVALTTLPQMGPARLLTLLGRWSPVQAWQRVVAANAIEVPDLARAWAAAAATIEPAGLLAAHRAAGIEVALHGHDGYPPALADDVEPPAVLFWRGDPTVLHGPRAAVVGTRRCTRYGYDVARQLGSELAAAGVTVVSGLAAGIDAAVHHGALDVDGAAPVAVVGTGLDVVYPAANAALWRRVEAAGIVLGEAPLGVRPERWRFPARNRVIAALADVVVAVESRPEGGAMYTVAEALRRDRTVLAVPGSVRSPTSAGTNRLLAEGAAPACDTEDVLVALGLSAGGTRRGRPRRGGPPLEAIERAVLDALGWEPRSLDQLAMRCELPLGELTLTIVNLEAKGLVVRRDGWFERVHPGTRP